MAEVQGAPWQSRRYLAMGCQRLRELTVVPFGIVCASCTCVLQAIPCCTHVHGVQSMPKNTTVSSVFGRQPLPRNPVPACRGCSLSAVMKSQEVVLANGMIHARLHVAVLLGRDSCCQAAHLQDSLPAEQEAGGGALAHGQLLAHLWGQRALRAAASASLRAVRIACNCRAHAA